jgi:hypothetical protein
MVTEQITAKVCFGILDKQSRAQNTKEQSFLLINNSQTKNKQRKPTSPARAAKTVVMTF